MPTTAQKLKLAANTAFEFTVKLFVGTEDGKFGQDDKFVLTDLNGQDRFFYVKSNHPVSATLKSFIGRKLILGKGDSAFYTKDIGGNAIGNAPKAPNVANAIATPNATPRINDITTPFDTPTVNDAVRVSETHSRSANTQTTGYNNGIFGENKEFAILVQSILHTEVFAEKFKKLYDDNNQDETVVFKKAIIVTENLIREINAYKNATNEI